MIEYTLVSNPGLKRNENQDSICLNSKIYANANVFKSGILFKKQLKFGVFDGVGGLEKGDVASKESAKYLSEKVKLTGEINRIDMVNLVQKLNNNLVSIQNDLKAYKMMTTLIIGYLCNNTLNVINVGDSRGYYYNGETLKKISVDDTYRNKLLKERKYSIEEINQMDVTHIITNSLGVKNFDKNKAHTFSINLSKNDIIIVMSDGVSDLIKEKEFVKLFNEKKTTKSISKEIESIVLKRGAHDNYSFIVFKTK